jgi:inorganic pyrophosphatase/exopolyphosphatase
MMGVRIFYRGGIIDHRALEENIYTKAPLLMDVRPWVGISTSITYSFSRSALTIPVDVARLLLCAIMSDSVNLTSPTTTFQKKINSTLRWIIPVGQTLFIFCYC